MISAWFHLVENSKYFIFTLNLVPFIWFLHSTKYVKQKVSCCQTEEFAFFGNQENGCWTSIFCHLKTTKARNFKRFYRKKKCLYNIFHSINSIQPKNPGFQSAWHKKIWRGGKGNGRSPNSMTLHQFLLRFLGGFFAF